MMKPIISPRYYKTKEKLFDPEWMQNGLNVGYSKSFFLDLQSHFIENPKTEEMINCDFPQFFKNMVLKSIEYILENRLAIEIAPWDCGHGHILVSKEGYQVFSQLTVENEKALFVINNCEAILWHTQEFYQFNDPNYPLDHRKRNIFISKSSEIQVIDLNNYPKKQDLETDTIKADEFIKKEGLNLQEVASFEVRSNPEGQVKTKYGNIQIFIPHQLSFEKQE